MKIAYLVNQYPKGSHTFIRREISALEALGVEVLRFSIRRAGEELSEAADREEAARTRVMWGEWLLLSRAVMRRAAADPVRFARTAALAARLGFGSDRGLLAHGAYVAEACLLAEWLQSAGCGHLHVHFGTNPAMVAMLCRELGGPGYSFTVHGPEEFDRAQGLALDEKVRRASFAVTISRFGKAELAKYCPPDAHDKLHVVPCGLDSAFLSAEPVPVTADPRLVCVARLTEQKGLLVLLDAAARLVQRGVEFELRLVGDGELRASLEERIESLNLTGRVVILGWRDADGVRDEICRARALVLPSFAEGLPVAIMEALALGRPVVSTTVAAIPELVRSGVSGWLVPAGSADLLAASLEAVLRAPVTELAAMGAAGRAAVRERHDISKSAQSLFSLFAEAMG